MELNPKYWNVFFLNHINLFECLNLLSYSWSVESVMNSKLNASLMQFITVGSRRSFKSVKHSKLVKQLQTSE